ncbi:response regulator [Aggregatibacter actinomycetemcomitans]|uniref:response regulator n=1 Tax=Aggregatibacter actinomycetemcomitans TaxID=714 RepID=UPI0011D4BABA|nr:response regulator [Aggregatibacter actinomycetemcomitans]TYA24602.1 response regulator [Aggregatibacter actinomycetemcomitans]
MAKILLVDDDAELTELLAQLLDLEGFQVNVANNGKEALELLDHSYDLILLDIMMPVLNGIETLKQIRKNYSTPVMMLTARGDDIDRILGLELGADDYLPKPFNDRAIDMHMSNLRKKLPARSDDLPWFKTLRGRGYLLIAEK